MGPARLWKDSLKYNFGQMNDRSSVVTYHTHSTRNKVAIDSEEEWVKGGGIPYIQRESGFCHERFMNVANNTENASRQVRS